MTPNPALTTRLARWSLLLAALLQFASAVAGPAAHLGVRGADASALAEASQPSDREAPPHSELDCLFCHSATQQALPALPAATPLDLLAQAAELTTARALLATPAAPAPAARGPPLV